MNTTREIVAAWRARKATGEPCWCGKANDHVGWPVCAERSMPWDERPAAREEQGTPMAVLTVERAEDLAVRIVAAIDALDVEERRYADVRHYWHYAADRERIASDLAGLRDHPPSLGSPFGGHGKTCTGDHERRNGESGADWPCDDARRYADGLLRTADLYGVQP
jgi:hypothetical protein